MINPKSLTAGNLINLKGSGLHYDVRLINRNPVTDLNLPIGATSQNGSSFVKQTSGSNDYTRNLAQLGANGLTRERARVQLGTRVCLQYNVLRKLMCPVGM